MIHLIDLIPEADRPLLLTAGAPCDLPLAAALAEGDGEIVLPRGKMLLASTIHLKSRVRLVGEGGGQAGDAVTVLQLSPDCTGIVVHRSNTDGVEPAGPGAADGTIIEGVMVCGSGASGHGIELKARAKIKDCHVTGFGGDGVHIEASVAYEPPTNANCWAIDQVRVSGCGGHGLYVNGGDVNAGHAIGLDCANNGGWGVYDSGFLGNTYIGCHTSNNALGAYKTDDVNAKHVFVGCYSESGQPASSFSPLTLILGGLHGAGTSGGQGIGDGKLSPFSVKGINAFRSVTYRLGVNDRSGLEVVAQGDHPSGWSMGWWDETAKTVQFRHARVDVRVPFRLTTDMTPFLDEAGTPIGPGKMVMQGAWVKLASGRYRFVDFASIVQRLDALEA